MLELLPVTPATKVPVETLVFLRFSTKVPVQIATFLLFLHDSRGECWRDLLCVLARSRSEFLVLLCFLARSRSECLFLLCFLTRSRSKCSSTPDLCGGSCCNKIQPHSTCPQTPVRLCLFLLCFLSRSRSECLLLLGFLARSRSNPCFSDDFGAR